MAHVTFIHGISNKPPKDDLLRSWIAALEDDGGVDLDYEGVSYDMAYWADFLYAAPLAPSVAAEGLEAVDLQGAEEADLAWLATAGPEEAAVMGSLAARIGFAVTGSEAVPTPPPEVDASLELLPPPLARRVMKTFLRDVHHYLFNARFSPRPGQEYLIQDDIRARVLDALAAGAGRDGPHIAVTHSMGTVIIYDLLRRVPGCPPLDGLVTIGSPLGLDEVQHCLKPEWSRTDGFPSKALHGRWVNVFDRLDIVAAVDPRIGNDFCRAGRSVIGDVEEPNWGRWRHDIGKYLRGPRLRAEVRDLLGLGE